MKCGSKQAASKIKRFRRLSHLLLRENRTQLKKSIEILFCEMKREKKQRERESARGEALSKKEEEL